MPRTAGPLTPRQLDRGRSAAGREGERYDVLVRELLAEAAGLALETRRADVAGWWHATCERITGDAGARATWDEMAIDRTLLEAVTPPVAHGITCEALVWWCVHLVPPFLGEPLDDARRRTTTCALYLSVMVVQAFTADDPASRERAGLLAALGTIVARRSRSTANAA